jgi:hypothetical protein
VWDAYRAVPERFVPFMRLNPNGPWEDEYERCRDRDTAGSSCIFGRRTSRWTPRRLCRSMRAPRPTACRYSCTPGSVRDREIVLRSLREDIDTSNATGRMVAGVLASLAEFELELGRERRAAAREARRARGQAIGRPKALDKSKAALARRMHTSGEPVSTIAATLDVSRATVYRVLAEQDDDSKQTVETAATRIKPRKPVRHRRTDRTTAMAYIRTHETKQRARGKPVKRLPHRQHHPGFQRRHPRSRGSTGSCPRWATRSATRH